MTAIHQKETPPIRPLGSLIPRASTAQDAQAAAAILTEAKNSLKKHRAELDTLLADQRVRQWTRVDFDLYQPVLDFYNMPQDINAARQNYPPLARQIIEKITHLENEIGGLEIDIRYGSVPARQARARAENMVAEESALEKIMAEARLIGKVLIDSDTKLRGMLAICPLLPHAQRLLKNKENLLADGYRYYEMMRGGGRGNGGGRNFAEYAETASELESHLKNIDLAGLPGLVAAIVDRQLLIALQATDQIKQTLENINRELATELNHVKQLEEELLALQKSDIVTILASLNNVTRSLGNSIIALHHKASAMKQLKLMPVLLADVGSFYTAVNGALLTALRQETKQPDSLLNPATIALERTTEYFIGLKGLLRTIKLFLTSIGGRQAISRLELVDKLMQALHSCPEYFSTAEADHNRLNGFIDGLLVDFSRPFPHAGLFECVKKTMALYGARAGKFIHGFTVSASATTESDTALSSQAGQTETTLGRLITKIEIRQEYLKTGK